jgi:cytochrome b pre-mRNA-processing protein 3
MLVKVVTEASRRPSLYGEGKVPDTIEGRFELMTVAGALALIRLQSEPGAGPLAQVFVDRLFSLFDAGLREAGTSDTAVPKRMRALAAAFYGRLDAYRSALSDLPRLEAALARNVWRRDAHPFAATLARHVANTAAVQAKAPISAMFAAEGWPPA